MSSSAWNPSAGLRARLAAEYADLARKASLLALRERRLAKKLQDLGRTRDAMQRKLDELRELGYTSEDPLAPLKGVDIRETAVRLLIETGRGRDPIHYRDWFDIVLAAGYRPTGKDPLATFLTEINRSPVVRRTTHAGVYELDPTFPARAEAELGRLRQNGPRTGAVDLQAEIDRLERRLDEAARSLGETIDARAA